MILIMIIEPTKKYETFNVAKSIIEEFGNMSAQEMTEHCSVNYRYLYRACKRANGYTPKLMYIASWNRCEGSSGSPVPVWALGNKEDAKKPKKLKEATYQRRYYERNREKIRCKRKAKTKTGPVNHWLRMLTT